mmetsp:Transcript_34192/g.102058  ORF Transcript_34192/g.102058 Transcript_34192/m.102058 type:complete len:356 (+) Transcript_34192:541-1608(+)
MRRVALLVGVSAWPVIPRGGPYERVCHTRDVPEAQPVCAADGAAGQAPRYGCSGRLGPSLQVFGGRPPVGAIPCSARRAILLAVEARAQAPERPAGGRRSGAPAGHGAGVAEGFAGRVRGRLGPPGNRDDPAPSGDPHGADHDPHDSGCAPRSQHLARREVHCAPPAGDDGAPGRAQSHFCVNRPEPRFPGLRNPEGGPGHRRAHAVRLRGHGLPDHGGGRRSCRGLGDARPPSPGGQVPPGGRHLGLCDVLHGQRAFDLGRLRDAEIRLVRRAGDGQEPHGASLHAYGPAAGWHPLLHEGVGEGNVPRTCSGHDAAGRGQAQGEEGRSSPGRVGGTFLLRAADGGVVDRHIPFL